MTRGNHPLAILMVEDNPADVRLVREVFAEFGAAHQLEAIASGAAALERLRRAEKRPDLILLDLNLPGMHGRELLSTLKSDSELKSIPVIVLTSSRAPADVLDCYERRANSYVVKPLDYVGMRDTLMRLEEYWSRVAEIPTRTS